ncbi:unnamed protein product [Paramecium octaurelia]|uniref:Uncharacterized protein n=1 Tax=Paramecium octaurelia TaxID=43137 RepID=A0A8S1VP15_PAROT|nr:unnamed protein product [Paramecium octaurelia]
MNINSIDILQISIYKAILIFKYLKLCLLHLRSIPYSTQIQAIKRFRKLIFQHNAFNQFHSNLHTNSIVTFHHRTL